MQGRTAPEPSTWHGNFKRRRRTIETRSRRMRIARTKADSRCPRRKEPLLWSMRADEQRAMHPEEYALEDVPTACPHGLFDSDWNNGLRRRDHSKQFASQPSTISSVRSPAFLQLWRWARHRSAMQQFKARAVTVPRSPGLPAAAPLVPTGFYCAGLGGRRNCDCDKYSGYVPVG